MQLLISYFFCLVVHVCFWIFSMTACHSFQLDWLTACMFHLDLRYVHTVSVRFGISIRFSIRVSFRVRRSVHTHQFYSDEPSVFLPVSFILGAKILAFSCAGAHGKFLAAGVRQFKAFSQILSKDLLILCYVTRWFWSVWWVNLQSM